MITNLFTMNESSDSSRVIKFKVGGVYTAPGLGGSSYDVKVVDRTRDSITFIEVDYPAEGTDTFKVKVRDGAETVPVWTYRGHTGYLRADVDPFGNRY